MCSDWINTVIRAEASCSRQGQWRSVFIPHRSTSQTLKVCMRMFRHVALRALVLFGVSAIC